MYGKNIAGWIDEVLQEAGMKKAGGLGLPSLLYTSGPGLGAEQLMAWWGGGILVVHKAYCVGDFLRWALHLKWEGGHLFSAYA